ncbi:hypothetical protein B0I72DRAFT_143194 [Yarrowia lipolytica]|uniref:YALI0A18029p n=2 Tax=Yarrowia lipolytica TaxID=4952 RepID=Q6CGM6_YARLI|nr:YALI0A18029p [Yarrowia lipolytica CLIB122]QNP95421.1 Hypothetical protein YALI2_A00420g [Yarrowia lipolytica]RDW23683.1 hypothetical protein B0I71DRAFT_135567 [Yarrowia lipolytica]RDW29446.1 hypothetical protein B0I72DRAFT_143194 [Yarrowia lipolytica]RDW43578.1 hypothetical protein B0I74DRAFT_141851 [Yarrowia lipolytica]RDW50398.1 hypothetical protein B0I75DRAFT_141592 [Yarrowia lipolytica]|eukprot:XP_500186.1 YALI0A18029p [Yarrowia lipolytica CLIB122]
MNGIQEQQMTQLYLPQTEDLMQLHTMLSQLQIALKDNEEVVEKLIRQADKYTLSDVMEEVEATKDSDSDEYLPSTGDSDALLDSQLSKNAFLRTQVAQQTKTNSETLQLVSEYRKGLGSCLDVVRQLAWEKTVRNINLHRDLQPGYFERNQQVDAMQVENAEIRREIELEVNLLRKLVREGC